MLKKCVGVLVMIGLLLSLSGVALAEKAKVTVLAGASRTATYEQWEVAFEKAYPNIDLVLEVCPDAELFASLMLRAAAGTLPDTFWTVTDYRMDQLRDGGALYPLDELVEVAGLDMETYPKAFIDVCRRDGTLWSFPYQINRKESLHYNIGVFDELGLAYPTHDMSWEDFKALCEKLVEKDDKGNITRYGVLNKYVPYGWVYLSGGRFVDDYLNPTKVRFNEDVFKNALAEYLEMNESGATMPLPIMKALGGYALPVFGGQHVAMIMSDLGYCGGFANVDFEWGAVEPPHPEGADYAYLTSVYGISMSAKVENPQAAFSWIAWNVLSEASLQIKEGLQGCNHNLIPFAPELQEAYAKIAATRKPDGWEHVWEMDKRGITDVSFAGSQDFSPLIMAGIWDVLYGREPMDSLDDVAEEAQEILDEINSRK